jgi:hypothetical protein
MARFAAAAAAVVASTLAAGGAEVPTAPSVSNVILGSFLPTRAGGHGRRLWTPPDNVWDFEAVTFSHTAPGRHGTVVNSSHTAVVVNTTAFTDDYLDASTEMACRPFNVPRAAGSSSSSSSSSSSRPAVAGILLPGEAEEGAAAARLPLTLDVTVQAGGGDGPAALAALWARMTTAEVVVIGAVTRAAALRGSTPDACALLLPADAPPTFAVLAVRREPGTAGTSIVSLDLQPAGILSPFAALSLRHVEAPAPPVRGARGLSVVTLATNWAATGSGAQAARMEITHLTGATIDCDRCYGRVAVTRTTDIQLCVWAYVGVRIPWFGGRSVDLRGLGSGRSDTGATLTTRRKRTRTQRRLALAFLSTSAWK